MKTLWTIGPVTLHFLEPVCRRTAMKYLTRRTPQPTNLWRTT